MEFSYPFYFLVPFVYFLDKEFHIFFIIMFSENSMLFQYVLTKLAQALEPLTHLEQFFNFFIIYSSSFDEF